MSTNAIETVKPKLNAVEKLQEQIVTTFDATKQLMLGNMQLREKALESFKSKGFPNRKSEEYKYVNMELMLKDNFSFSTSKKITPQQLSSLAFLTDAFVVVILNGSFVKELSSITNLPKGLTISNWADAVANNKTVFENYFSSSIDLGKDAFLDLNLAMSLDGAFIQVSKNATIETPIHIIHISSTDTTLFNNSKNVIVVEENAQATIVESFETIATTAKVFNNAVTQLVVDANANVDHYKLQNENEFGYLVSTTNIQQQKQSVCTTHTFTLNGTLVRNNLTIVLDGEHIESHLNGLYLTKENQVVDNHTLVDHRKPNCNSNELYKGIIDEKSSATFNGKIYVRKDAQKTNAFQSNKNILLSDDGTINTKPQLEIYADDVKCSHGTSTGKLDEEKIFYLRSRGLSEASAKKLLMYAFASEVTATIKVEELKEYIETKITERFE